MLQPPESTWAIVAPDVTLIVEVTGIVATARNTPGTGIGTENVTAIVHRVATTGTVVTENRIGTGVTEKAPGPIPLIAGGKGAILAARLLGAQDVLANVNVTVINPKNPGGVLQ